MALGGSRWIKLLEKARVALSRFQRRNDRKRAKTNVERHYDHDRRLYGFFLDADQQYSCAYFEREGQSLEEAQLAKKRHLAAKLLVEEGQSVLDIGSGFGGMALYLAQVVGARAVGVTLSEEQFAISSRRAAESGLGDRVEFRMQDYRDVGGAIRPHRFGRHVRARRPRRLRRVLRHRPPPAQGRRRRWCCTRSAAAKGRAPPTRGSGNTSSPAAISPASRRRWRRSNARVSTSPTSRFCGCITPTRSRNGARRFLAHRDEVKAIYDERFCRMWEFYLVGSEVRLPRLRPHGVPHPARQAPGRRAAHARLRRRTRGASCASAKASRARSGGWRAEACGMTPITYSVIASEAKQSGLRRA